MDDMRDGIGAVADGLKGRLVSGRVWFWTAEADGAGRGKMERRSGRLTRSGCRADLAANSARLGGDEDGGREAGGGLRAAPWGFGKHCSSLGHSVYSNMDDMLLTCNAHVLEN